MALFAFVVLSPVLLALPAARAEDTGRITQCLFEAPRYEAVWHPGTVKETLATQLRMSELTARDSQLRPNGWRIKEIRATAYVCAGTLDSLLFDVLWRQEPSVDDTWVAGWAWTDFINRNNSLRSQGYRLTFTDSYSINNQVFFNGVWRKSSAGQIDDQGWSPADFASRIQQMSAQGWEAVYVNTFQGSSGGWFYDASWRPRTTTNQYVLGWAPQDFDNRVSQMRTQGWDLLVVSTQGSGSGLRYDGIFRPLNKSEIRTKDMSASSFGQQQMANAAAGWNMETFIRHW